MDDGENRFSQQDFFLPVSKKIQSGLCVPEKPVSGLTSDDDVKHRLCDNVKEVMDVKGPLSKWFGSKRSDWPDETDTVEEIKEIPVEQIVPNRFQPRTVFDDERIEELSQTIRTHGVIQPIVVRAVEAGQYELIAGERRWRAVKKLNLPTIPAIVRSMNDTQAASVALIENLQREGLTAIEEAYAYQQLLQLHGLTQESLAQRLGKGQSTIANKLRLLQLPPSVHEAIMKRQITERHARALLSLPTAELQEKVLAEILQHEWNVKQTEERVKQLTAQGAEKPAKTRRRRTGYSKDVRLALNTIRESLKMISGTGMNIEAKEEEYDEFVQFTIRIPKK